MHRTLTALAVTCALAVSASAQIPADVIYSNISTAGGNYHDALVLCPNGDPSFERPLAQEINGGTGSVGSRPVLYRYQGQDALMWFDNIVDRVYVSVDRNGNGAMDPSEWVVAWDAATLAAGNISPDSFSFDGTRALMSCDFGAQGVIELVDLDADELFNSPGETTLVFDGSVGTTTTVGGFTISIDDVETADYIDGQYVYYEDDDGTVFAYDPVAGAHKVWFNYQNGNFPLNADIFNGRLASGGTDLDRIAVDHSTTPATVYMGYNFSSSAPYVYQARDLNGDGDVQDSGEVRLFVDGNATASPVIAIDDIDFFSGVLFLSHELGTSGSNAGELMQFIDLNGDRDANDPGEQFVTGMFPATNDPSILSVTAVPAGIFGVTSCVEANIETSGVTSAGGLLTFDITNIPAGRQGGTDLCVVGLSSTFGGYTVAGPGCTIGLGVDFLTLYLLNNFIVEFSTPAITASSATTTGFMVPAGLAPGTTLEYAGLFVGATFGATQTKLLVVQ